MSRANPPAALNALCIQRKLLSSTRATTGLEKEKSNVTGKRGRERHSTRHAREINTHLIGYSSLCLFLQDLCFCPSSADPQLPINPRQAFPAVWHRLHRKERCFTAKPQACKKIPPIPLGWGARTIAVSFLHGLGNTEIFTVWPPHAHMWRVAFRGDNLRWLSWGQLAARCDGVQSTLSYFLKGENVDLVLISRVHERATCVHGNW